jgi:gluconolactonase
LTVWLWRPEAGQPLRTIWRIYEFEPIPGVIAAGATWQQAWQGFDNADGILGTPDGNVLFAQEQPSTIRKLDQNDFDSAYVKDTHGAGSVGMDSAGRLIAVQRTCTDPGRAPLPCDEPTKVSIIYPEGERRVLADNVEGRPLARLNDLVVATTGTVFFSGGTPYYIPHGGQAIGIDASVRSNGITLSPDERTLYATNREVVVAFDVRPDGTVGNRRDFAQLQDGNGDGLAVDGTGRLYVATQRQGIQVFTPGGDYIGTIQTPRNVASLAFAGPDKRMLYITTGGALAPNGQEFMPAEGIRNNAKTIYKIPMLAQGYTGRPK